MLQRLPHLVQTNLIALGLAAVIGAAAWVTSIFRRSDPA